MSNLHQGHSWQVGGQSLDLGSSGCKARPPPPCNMQMECHLGAASPNRIQSGSDRPRPLHPPLPAPQPLPHPPRSSLNLVSVSRRKASQPQLRFLCKARDGNVSEPHTRQTPRPAHDSLIRQCHRGHQIPHGRTGGVEEK